MSGGKLPPHGKQFAEARSRGMVPRRKGLGHLVVTLDWNETTAGMPHIIITPDTNMDTVNLSFCAGLYATIIHTDQQSHRVQEVIDALLAAGTQRVDACNRDALDRGDDLNSAWPVFEREALRHAA